MNPRVALFLLLAALASNSASAGETPRLTHSAPFLGQVLHLSVEGAPARSHLVLYYSPAAGDLATPFGDYELDRTTTQVAAIALTDAAGHLSIQIGVPFQSSLAEVEAHYQALVRDPDADSGATFSTAVHLRFVGSRAYVTSRGDWPPEEPEPRPGGLAIVSAVHDELVAEVDLGLAPSGLFRARGDDAPVFARDMSRGAVISPSSELVLFDPFFGNASAVAAIEEASRTLQIGPVEGTLLVLETGYRLASADTHGTLHLFDIESGALLDELALPGLAPGLWVTSADNTAAYVAMVDSDTGSASVCLVDLVGWQVRGSVVVGPEGHTSFSDMLLMNGQVFVTSTDEDPKGWDSRLTRLDLASFDTDQVFTLDVCDLEPAPATDQLLLGCYSFFGFGGNVRAVPLSAPSPVTDFPGLPPGFFVPGPVRARGTDAWILDLQGNEPSHGDDPARLWHLDLLSSTWTLYPTVWFEPEGPPLAMDVVRDTDGDRILLGRKQNWTPGPTYREAELLILDPADRSETSVTIAPWPYAVHSVPVHP